MKNKILLFLILLSSISFAQVSNGGEQEFDYGIKNNASTEIATPPFLVSQGIDGTYGKMNRNNVIEYLEFASAVNLPVTGEQGKLYLTKDNNRLYRFNGTIYQELTTDISGKEDIANKQNSLAVDGTNTKYPTVTAVNTGLALKANLASPALTGTPTAPTPTTTTGIANKSYVDGLNNGNVKLTGNQAINGQKTFNETTTFDGIGNSANFQKFITISDGTLTSNTYSNIALGSLNGNFGITSSGFGRALLSTSNIGTTARTFTFPDQNGTFALTSNLSSYEPLFTKNTAFNKNFGTTAGTVVEGGTLGTNAYSSTAYLPLSGGTLNGNLIITGVLKGITFDNPIGQSSGITQSSSGSPVWNINKGAGDSSENYNIYNFTRDKIDFSLKNNTGEATFSSTVTASPATLSNHVVVKSQLDAVVARPYKVYTALLNQSGTSAPVATVLENTLGGTVVWSRNSLGSYSGTLSGVFTTNKTYVSAEIGELLTGYGDNVTIYKQSTINEVALTTIKTNTNSDGVLKNSPLEIRVYL